MNADDSRELMMRCREDALMRIGMLTRLVESLDAVYALPAQGKAITSPAAPKAAPPPPRPQRPASPATNGTGPVDKVINALRSGPKSPGELAEMLGMTVSGASYHVKKLVTAGRVTVSGSTSQRTIALT